MFSEKGLRDLELYAPVMMLLGTLVFGLVQCTAPATAVSAYASPTDFLLEEHEDDSLFLKWKSLGDDKMYRLYRMKMEKADAELLTETKHTSFVDEVGCSQLKFYKVTLVENDRETLLANWTAGRTADCK